MSEYSPPPIPYGTKPNTNPDTQAAQHSLGDAASVVRINALYFPNYRVYRGETPASLNYGYVNHVYYAFANIAVDGGVSVRTNDSKLL